MKLHRLRPLAYAGSSLVRRLQARAGMEAPRPPVGIVTERADWAIRWWGEFITSEANKLSPGLVWTTSDPARLTSGLVEFGSQYQCVEWARFLSPQCRIVSTFFHGKPEDGPQVARHIDDFLKLVPRLERVVASASIVARRLKDWGVPEDSIAQIPIGCETWRFLPPSPQQKQQMRARFAIQPHETVIGSFQKDGDGWGEGHSPKLIKGPDVFLQAIEGLARHRPVFVLLSGPARGYVRAGLDRLGIRYAHTYVETRDELASLYHALDLYLVTSREEGGPMALMESMASHVPVVATRVGMAPDLITHRASGALVDVGDTAAIMRESQYILDLGEAQAEALKCAARQAVLATDWKEVARMHIEQVWQAGVS